MKLEQKQELTAKKAKRGYFSETGRTSYGRFGRVAKSPKTHGVAFKENISPNTAQNILSHMPAKAKSKVVIPTDPTTAFTPRRTTMLKVVGKLGPFTMFSSDRTVTPRKVDISDLKRIEDVAEILEPAENKYIKATFNKEQMQTVRRIKKRQNGRRKTSQAKAIAGHYEVELEDGETVEKRISASNASANKIAKLYGIKYGRQKFEWTHLIAYRFVGEKGQIADNLVLATKECNSLMMLFEDAIVELANTLRDPKSSIELTVKADTVADTHYAQSIYYNIKIPELNFDLTVKFDTQMTNSPTVNFEEAVAALIKYALDCNGPCGFCTPIKDTKNTVSKHDIDDDDQVVRQIVL